MLSIVSVVSVLIVSESTLAAGESINIRLKNQASQIQKGCNRGQLTKGEKKTLNNEQERIKALIKSLSSDQDFSPEDQKKVHSALNLAGVHIFRQRYNKKSKPQKTK